MLQAGLQTGGTQVTRRSMWFALLAQVVVAHGRGSVCAAHSYSHFWTGLTDALLWKDRACALFRRLVGWDLAGAGAGGVGWVGFCGLCVLCPALSGVVSLFVGMWAYGAIIIRHVMPVMGLAGHLGLWDAYAIRLSLSRT